MRGIQMTRGVLTLTWYLVHIMCLPFGVLFHEIWYSHRGFFIRDRGTQIVYNWVYFGQIIVKSTQFGQNWVLPFENGVLMGGKLGKKLV